MKKINNRSKKNIKFQMNKELSKMYLKGKGQSKHYDQKLNFIERNYRTNEILNTTLLTSKKAYLNSRASFDASKDKIYSESTLKQYMKTVNNFTKYIQEHYPSYYKENFMSCEKYVQEYLDYEYYIKGNSPSLINSKASALAKIFRTTKMHYVTPVRHYFDTKKGRDKQDIKIQRKYKRADQNQDNPKYDRMIKLAKSIGVRNKKEFCKIMGRDYNEDKYGRAYIQIHRGKGNKSTKQYILDKDKEYVKLEFSKLEPNEYLLNDKERKNRVDLHSIRREHSREIYYYYEKCLEENPDYRNVIRQRIADRLEECGGILKEDLDVPYIIRGKQRAYNIANNLPISYQRDILILINLEHLSHFRSSVTIENYIAH